MVVFDWKRLVVGRTPKSLDSAIKQIRYWKFVYFICLLVFVLVFFGVRNLELEVDVCWSELQGYRFVNQSGVVGWGVNSSVGAGCEVVGDFFVCDEGLV